MSATGNKNVILIMGRPNVGKSHSLIGLKNPEKIAYFNTDLKELPFPSKFKINKEISSPYDILAYIDEIEEKGKGIETVVLDTLTYLFDMFENQIIGNAVDTQQAWGEYGQFYQTLLNKIKKGTKNYIILAHEAETYDKKEMVNDVSVPLKGATRRKGVEGDFSNILQARTISIATANQFPNDYLHISDDEREDGIKRVFVTRITADTLGHKIRSSYQLWKREELYIDNNIDAVLTKIQDYYKK